MFTLLSATLDAQRRQPRRFSAQPDKRRLEYIQRLLDAFRAARDGSELSSHSSDNALTRRELEVVRLLVARLPYKEIAAALVISEDTAKWHIKNVYRKLHVSDRNQLIARAGELDRHA